MILNSIQKRVIKLEKKEISNLKGYFLFEISENEYFEGKTNCCFKDENNQTKYFDDKGKELSEDFLKNKDVFIICKAPEN